MKDQDSIEERVRSIWSDVLGVEVIGVNDDFFALGGDSVLVVVMTMKVEESFDIVLDPGQIFETPSLEGFAQSIRDIGFS